MTTITFKRGATFAPDLTARQYEGGPARNLTGWVIESQVRVMSGALVASLALEGRNDAAGTYRLRATEGTAAWPLDQLQWDIRYTAPDGAVLPSETVSINVVKQVTQ